MQIKNDIEGWNLLQSTINQYFKRDEKRTISYFLETKNEEWGFFYQHFLLDRKHIFRYGIGQDRETWIGGLELAIGPHYFGPADFWSSAASERFQMAASTEAVEHNLRLLNEFLETR